MSLYEVEETESNGNKQKAYYRLYISYPLYYININVVNIN